MVVGNEDVSLLINKSDEFTEKPLDNRQAGKKECEVQWISLEGSYHTVKRILTEKFVSFLKSS